LPPDVPHHLRAACLAPLLPGPSSARKSYAARGRSWTRRCGRRDAILCAPPAPRRVRRLGDRTSRRPLRALLPADAPGVCEDVRRDRTPAAVAPRAIGRLLRPGPRVEGKRHGAAGRAARSRRLSVAAAQPTRPAREDPLRRARARGRGGHLLRAERERVSHDAPALPVERAGRHHVLRSLVLSVEEPRADGARAPPRAPPSGESAAVALPRPHDRRERARGGAARAPTPLAGGPGGLGLLRDRARSGHR